LLEVRLLRLGLLRQLVSLLYQFVGHALAEADECHQLEHGRPLGEVRHSLVKLELSNASIKNPPPAVA
jgi:hypothetical protein